MAIIAQRQRRRFMQVRRLKIKVPRSYKRIHSIRKFPNAIQKELVKYKVAIEDDSEYESDHAVLKNYAEDPVSYIKKKDDSNRDEIEMNGNPRRLLEARKKLGLQNYDIIQNVMYEAINESLER